MWHTHILEEGSGAAQLRGPYGIWLDLLEQVRQGGKDRLGNGVQ